MKTLLTLLVASLMVLSIVPGVLAVSIGTGVGVDITTEQFAPRVWLCGERVVTDDSLEPGRITGNGTWMAERLNNYAFEGEQVQWEVLVMDKNKIDQNIDVYGTVGSTQGAGNPIEVNCLRNDHDNHDYIYRYGQGEINLFDACNARIQEEYVQWDSNLMSFFTCQLTVETADSMYGEYWVTVEAMDGDGMTGTMAENEFWFFNPVVALSIDGDLSFTDVRPGTDAYSNTLLVGTDADAGSGVLLDMFISGTDFYDSSSSGARCPTTNQLSLSNFRYFATSGAYSTLFDIGVGRSGIVTVTDRNSDSEGYVNIGYGNGFNNPNPFYNGYEIIQSPVMLGPYYAANILAPGAEMALTFKLSMPSPCQGNFDTGSLYFWGEAI